MLVIRDKKNTSITVWKINSSARKKYVRVQDWIRIIPQKGEEI